MPGGDTICLVWFGGLNGELAPLNKQKWVWPVLLPREIETIFKSDARELNSKIWFVGTYQSWPLADARNAMRDMFQDKHFIAVHAFGSLMPLEIVLVAEEGTLVTPANFTSIHQFALFIH